jgi:hypothetical protein
LWLDDASLQGKTVLIHSEQGIGDSIQFSRYLPLFKALGVKKLWVEVQKPLLPLLATLDCDCSWLGRGEALPDFDYHCPLLSLPLAFKTTLETIPLSIPYLSVLPEKRQNWHARLGAKTKPRIGIAWSGAIKHKNDHNRSLPLAKLLPLTQLDVELHSLQKEVRDNDLPVFQQTAIINHADALRDFADTAALIDAMDLVICVDTSVAHLAGALGKPVWLLLAWIPDFRWLTQREDSPWYPTARLFRQKPLGAWEEVIERIAADVTLFLR